MSTFEEIPYPLCYGKQLTEKTHLSPHDLDKMHGCPLVEYDKARHRLSKFPFFTSFMISWPACPHWSIETKCLIAFWLRLSPSPGFWTLVHPDPEPGYCLSLNATQNNNLFTLLKCCKTTTTRGGWGENILYDVTHNVKNIYYLYFGNKSFVNPWFR